MTTRFHKTLLLLAGLAAGHTAPAGAAVFVLKDRAEASLTIHIGSGGKSVSTVSFDVPAASIGSGVPVTGSRRIKIQLVIRATAATPLIGYLSVDSSIPLSNGAGATIPMSSISWESRDGEIPSGTFSGTSNQLLATFPSSTRVMDWHTFSFANDAVYDTGTYSGQITYTWSAP